MRSCPRAVDWTQQYTDLPRSSPGRMKLHPDRHNANRPRRLATRRERYAAVNRKTFAERVTQSTLRLVSAGRLMGTCGKLLLKAVENKGKLLPHSARICWGGPTGGRAAIEAKITRSEQGLAETYRPDLSSVLRSSHDLAGTKTVQAQMGKGAVRANAAAHSR